MDLYAIHKSFLDMQSSFGSNSDMSESTQARSREEMARLSKLINMAIIKGINCLYPVKKKKQSNKTSIQLHGLMIGHMINPSNMRTYDLSYESDSEEQPLLAQRPSSTEFNPSLLLPFGRGASNSPNHSGSSRVTLADQFT